MEEEFKFLLEIPKVEKAWRIICWIISRVTAGVAGVDGCEGRSDDEAECTDDELEEEALAW